jgi:hypothetical protein
MTKNQAISDIILRVTKGKPSDDLELEPLQVAFWLNIARAQLLKEYLDGKLEAGFSVDDYFVIQETRKPLNNETDPCIDADEERMYIRLKRAPVELFKDKAIVLIKTNEGSYVHKAKLDTIDTIRNLEFAKPSTKNVVYYRDGKTKLVIEGVPRSLEAVVEFLVWYIPTEDYMEMDDDCEMGLTNELAAILLDRVETIARRELFGFEDLANNGSQDIPPVVNG